MVSATTTPNIEKISARRSRVKSTITAADTVTRHNRTRRRKPHHCVVESILVGTAEVERPYRTDRLALKFGEGGIFKEVAALQAFTILLDVLRKQPRRK